MHPPANPKLSLVLALFFIILVQSRAAIISSNSALTPSSSSVWTSSNGLFSMGFFSLQSAANSSSGYYVGIWYASIPILNQSIIWTANRNQSAPINSTFRFTSDGRLQLTTPSSNPSNAATPIWEASSTSGGTAISNASQAELLDTGNFVLRDGASNILWQSFNHPTDTLLPGQNFSFASNPSLFSWSSINDPSPSTKYSLVFGNSGSNLGRVRLLYQNTAEYWLEPTPGTTGLFDTIMNVTSLATLNFYNGNGSLLFSSPSCAENGIAANYPKLQLSVDGNLRLLTWSSASSTWVTQWRALYLQCDVFGSCGNNGICDKNQNNMSVGGGGCPLPEANLEGNICVCPQGYTRNGSNCDPPSSLDYCTQYTSTMEHTSFDPPDTNADYSPVTQERCLDLCVDNCNCTAASYDSFSSGCWVYYDTSSLFNGLRYIGINQTSFIKTIDTSGGKGLPTYAIALIVVACSLIVLLIFAGLIIRHQIKLRYPSFKQILLDPALLDALNGPKRFSFKELYMVTCGFNNENKLGAGGFGSVYKGIFKTPHGHLDVAIKRLDLSQRHGIDTDKRKEDHGFLAEIQTLGSIKHVNVVRLMGFCAEGPERLLVYEFVTNGSLTSHIFNDSSILSWDMRFQIAVGAAMGIEYFHTYCPKKIVHRDIKPDNILLDEEFQAKVADFGVSKIMGPERTHLTNNTVRGTPTYMAPECWQVGALLTEKTDAYSYGMVLLELVSGRRVRKGQPVEDVEEDTEHELDSSVLEEEDMAESTKRKRRVLFLEKALEEMEKGSWESLVDERLEEYKKEEAERIVRIVFWCLQGNPEHRPTMEDLLLMIKGHKAVPQAPLLGLFDIPFTHGASNRSDASLMGISSEFAITEPFLSQGR